MADITTTSPEAINTPCPITKLPPELREMIYGYYLGDMKSLFTRSHEHDYRTIVHRSGKIHFIHAYRHPAQTNNFERLRPYLNILHFSSGVRSELALKIYRAVFPNVWFNLDIDGENNDIEAMKGMFAQIRAVDKDIKFGLHFTVSDHSRDTFFEFVDSFFGIHATGDHMTPAFVRCREDLETETLMLRSYSSSAKIEYTYRSESKDYHRLSMFGTLARLDWSKFEFKVPPPLGLKSRLMENSMDDPTRPPRRQGKRIKAVVDEERSYESEGDGIDVDLDSENEVVAFNSDDDDDECIIFDGGYEVVARDDRHDSEDENGLQFSECESDLDEDGDQLWIDIEL